MVPVDDHTRYLVPTSEVSRRLERLRAHLKKDDLTLAWIDHTTDRYYFSGSTQNGVLLVPAEGAATFLVRKSLTRAEVEAGVAVRRHPGRRGMPAELRRMAGKGRVALAMDVTTASTYVWVKEMLDGRDIADLSGIVRTLRSVKSPWEIDQIRGAAAQMNTLLGEVGERIRPGITELQLAGVVEGRLRQLGHGGTIRVRRPGADIAPSTVVSGASAQYPTAFDGPVGGPGPYPSAAAGAGWTTLNAGETVMLDIVTSHNGYHADTTRTFFLGSDLPREARVAHDFCREILRRIEGRLRPGELCSDIYRDVLSAGEEIGLPEGFMGYAENRVKFFGHGVGLELDELPVLAERVEIELQPGMVIAVEPKAFLTAVGPVGVENTYVVTDRGYENLCPVEDDVVLL